MPNIEVAIDKMGIITVTEPTVNNNTSITWTVKGGAITDITKGDAFFAKPVKDRNGNWSARIAVSAAGQRGYELEGQATDTTVNSERKSPKITVTAV